MFVRSMKSRFIVLCIFIIVVPLLIVFFFACQTYNEFELNNAYTNMKQANEKVCNSITMQLKEMELLLDIANHDRVETFFDSVPKKEKEQSIINAYKDIGRYKSDLEDIILLSLDNVNNLSIKNGEFVISSNTTSQEWYNKTVKGKGRSQIIPTHLEDYSSTSSGEPVITLSKLINNKESKPVGMLLIDISLERLQLMIENIGISQNAKVIVFDENGKVVLSSDESEIMEQVSDKILSIGDDEVIKKQITFGRQNTLVYCTSSDYTNWRIISMVPVNDISVFSSTSFIFILVIMVCWLILSVLLWGIVGKRISLMLHKIREKMNCVAEGAIVPCDKIKGPTEIRMLDIGMDSVVDRINSLMERNSFERKQIRMSELKALQAQINPHFLYNTLDSIVWLAEDSKLDEVITMTLALARFFRIAISKGKDVISISQEIEHIRNYLIIQSYRYENKFHYIIDVDREIINYKCPKLILQPLIENAIYHGIKNREDVGTIKVFGSKEDSKVLFEVMDNGIGMKKEQLKQVREYLDISNGETGKNSFGMKNVNDRIQLLFGPEYGVKIFSEFGKGTRVEIWLPVMDQD